MAPLCLSRSDDFSWLKCPRKLGTAHRVSIWPINIWLPNPTCYFSTSISRSYAPPNLHLYIAPLSLFLPFSPFYFHLYRTHLITTCKRMHCDFVWFNLSLGLGMLERVWKSFFSPTTHQPHDFHPPILLAIYFQCTSLVDPIYKKKCYNHSPKWYPILL